MTFIKLPGKPDRYYCANDIEQIDVEGNQIHIKGRDFQITQTVTEGGEHTELAANGLAAALADEVNRHVGNGGLLRLTTHSGGNVTIEAYSVESVRTDEGETVIATDSGDYVYVQEPYETVCKAVWGIDVP